MTRHSSIPLRSEGERGFTLTELLISLAIAVLVILAILGLFDLNQKLARTQTQMADLQQSLRVGQQSVMREVRMAGRGGLPAIQPPAGTFAGKFLPVGVAIEVDNNVADGTQLGGSASASVVAGTDVLTIRGVFSSPIYQINSTSGLVTLNPRPNPSTSPPTIPDTGVVQIADKTPTGVPQDLQPLLDAIADKHPVPIILVSPLGQTLYAVVELDEGNSDGDATQVSLAFKVQNGTHTADYLGLSPGATYPTDMNTVAFVGLLEEHRYYVREQRAVPGDSNSELVPQLTRARFYAGTDTPFAGSGGNLTEVVADNILDLQVALGVDTDNNELVDEGEPGGTPTPATDDWLFNDPGDNAAGNLWVGPLYYVRLTTLARSDRPEREYVSPPLTTLEDHAYNESDTPSTEAERLERLFRRRAMQTVVDMRNLS